jgi:hypothetical protein
MIGGTMFLLSFLRARFSPRKRFAAPSLLLGSRIAGQKGTGTHFTGYGVNQELGFRLLFTVSDPRLPAVTGYIKPWGL